MRQRAEFRPTGANPSESLAIGGGTGPWVWLKQPVQLVLLNLLPSDQPIQVRRRLAAKLPDIIGREHEGTCRAWSGIAARCELHACGEVGQIWVKIIVLEI